MGKNTEITYEYRDGNNYRTHSSVVLEGTLDKAAVGAIMSSLDGGMFFIPSQVGLVDLQSKLQVYDKRDNKDAAGNYIPYGRELEKAELVDDGDYIPPDHVWHAIQEGDIRETDDEPTVAMTAGQIVEKFRAAAGLWDEEGTVDRLRRELDALRSVGPS